MMFFLIKVFGGFNTQPPEGGWLKGGYYAFELLKFQHTAARRRLACPIGKFH